MNDQLQTSREPGGPHHLLNSLTGEWEGTTRTWFEPGVLADESRWTATIRPLLDGRSIAHEYSGSIGGKPLQGFALIGCNLITGMFEMALADSFHTGTSIMFCTGPRTEGGFSVLGEYPDGAGGPPWGWRTDFELSEPDRLVVAAFNITPGGEEALAVETRYHRR